MERPGLVPIYVGATGGGAAPRRRHRRPSLHAGVCSLRDAVDQKEGSVCLDEMPGSFRRCCVSASRWMKANAKRAPCRQAFCRSGAADACAIAGVPTAEIGSVKGQRREARLGKAAPAIDDDVRAKSPSPVRLIKSCKVSKNLSGPGDAAHRLRSSAPLPLARFAGAPGDAQTGLKAVHGAAFVDQEQRFE